MLSLVCLGCRSEPSGAPPARAAAAEMEDAASRRDPSDSRPHARRLAQGAVAAFGDGLRTQLGVVTGCVTYRDGTRAEVGFVFSVAADNDRLAGSAPLKGGCYRLVLADRHADGELFAVVSAPAMGSAVHPGGPLRGRIDLDLGATHELEVELLVHPRVTRERLALKLNRSVSLISPHRNLPWQALREAGFDLVRRIYPAPSHLSVSAVTGELVLSVSSVYNADSPMGVEAGTVGAYRVDDGDWVEVEWHRGLARIEVGRHDKVTLFVCGILERGCDELPPLAP